ncbi:MAG: EamA family transporter [bacterium]|jgi:transporter family protein
MWLILGLISAVFLGLYDVCKKASLRENAVLPVLFLATVSTALPFAVLAILSQWLGPESLGRAYVASVSWHVHGLLMLKSLIVASSWVCAYFAYKHLPITLGAPIRAAQPVLTLLGAMLIFSERFSLLGWCGMLTALGSYFALSVVGQKEGVRFVRNGWVGLLLMGAFLGAVSSLYDKYLLCRYAPMVVQAYFSLYLVVILGLVFALCWWPQRHRHTPFQWRWTIPAIGLLLAVADFCYFNALALPGSLIAMLSVVRRGNVLVSFSLGALIFKEKNIRQKAFALTGIVVGIILIGLG